MSNSEILQKMIDKFHQKSNNHLLKIYENIHNYHSGERSK